MLADYDVIIDAGGDASDPENAVPFDAQDARRQASSSPGNFNFLIETALFGTEPKFAAKGVKPDLDGDGKVSFGEAMPDADFYVDRRARLRQATRRELDAPARKWKPNAQDVFTALVVMTPTMSEYFERVEELALRRRREASEKAFVAASRLQDIADILGGLERIYAGVRAADRRRSTARRRGRPARACALHAFAERLRDAEAGGQHSPPSRPRRSAPRRRTRAEAIAGQISQAASRLDIELET